MKKKEMKKKKKKKNTKAQMTCRTRHVGWWDDRHAVLWPCHVTGLSRHWVVVVVEVMVVGHGIGLLVVAAVSCHGPATSPDGGGGRSNSASGASLRHH